MEIHWIRTIVAGIAMEIAFIIYVFGILRSSGVQNSIEGLAGALVLMGIGGFFAAKNLTPSDSLNKFRLESLLNGAFVGIVAMLLYMAIRIGGSFANGEGFIFPGFTLNHFVKILGGAIGAFACATISIRKSEGSTIDT